MEAIRLVAKAYEKRSLQDFDAALIAGKAQLVDDIVVHSHLSSLYDTLLEQNLCRLIEPYSRVEIAHLASLIELPVDTVLSKLSQVRIPPSCGPCLSYFFSTFLGCALPLTGVHRVPEDVLR